MKTINHYRMTESLPLFELDEDQPTTCPECGARTDFEELADGQKHTCPECGFQFLTIERD